MKNVSLEHMPIKLARIYIKARNLLNNTNISNSKLDKYSGVNHSTIYRVRNRISRYDKNSKKTGEWSVNLLTLNTTLLLANYPNKAVRNPINKRVDEFKYNYYLNLAEKRFGLNLEDLRSKLIEVTNSVNNISQLAHKTTIARTRLSRIKSGKFQVGQMHLNDLAILLNIWAKLHFRSLSQQKINK